jgi:hypothetical protein
MQSRTVKTSENSVTPTPEILENKKIRNVLDKFFKNTFLEIWADKFILG